MPPGQLTEHTRVVRGSIEDATNPLMAELLRRAGRGDFDEPGPPPFRPIARLASLDLGSAVRLVGRVESSALRESVATDGRIRARSDVGRVSQNARAAPSAGYPEVPNAVTLAALWDG